MVELDKSVLLFAHLMIAFLLIWCLPISSAAVRTNLREINLSIGSVKGSVRISTNGKKYSAFQGVPYAVPPTGKRRFARPEPLNKENSWNGTFDGTQNPPICTQPDGLGGIKGQEDCLVVNIYRPTSCNEYNTCAVMVWMHPGGFAMSDASAGTFGPDYFMDYDIVLVAVEYRLGVLGFLFLNINETPGNLGIRDQALALRMIKNEAPNFHGDPNRITLFGYGSGSQSVIFQILLPDNQHKNLFNRAICQSGSPVRDLSLLQGRVETHVHLAERLGKEIGCKQVKDSGQENLLNCLRKVRPEDLQRIGFQKFAQFYTQNDQTGDHTYIANPWVPYVDGQAEHVEDPVIKELPEITISKGDFDRIPVIIGDTSDSGLFLMGPFIQHPNAYQNFTELLPPLILKKSKENTQLKDLQIIETIKRYYLPGGSIHRLNVKHAINMMTDFSYHGPIGSTVELLTTVKNAAPVYHYIYKYSATHSLADVAVYPGWKLKIKTLLHGFGLGYNIRHSYGIGHGDDLLMIFKSEKLNWPTRIGIVTDRDKKTSHNILNYWTDFAKTGNPTPAHPDNKFTWEPVDPEDPQHALIASDSKMVSNVLMWTQVEFYKKITDALTNNAKVLNNEDILEILKVNDIVGANEKSKKTDL